jgi:hypothetical protein
MCVGIIQFGQVMRDRFSYFVICIIVLIHAWNFRFRYRGGQNTGNPKKLNRVCVGESERNSVGNTECSSVRLHSLVTALVIVLSDSPCERIGKLEAHPILKEDRSLVRVLLEHL